MKLLGFTIAVLALLGLAEVQPELAVGTAGLVTLGIVLMHPDALNSLFPNPSHPGNNPTLTIPSHGGYGPHE